MAEVIHTRKGKYQYKYEHTREGDKVVSRYMYPVDGAGDRVKPYQEKVAQQTPWKVTQSGISEYQRLTDEYERLRKLPAPHEETIDEMFERGKIVNEARQKMNEANPDYLKEQKQYEIEREKYIKEQKEKKKVFVTGDNIKKGMLIQRDNRNFEIVKVSRVNCYVLPYPSMPEIDEPKKVRIYDLSSYHIYKE